MRVLSRIDSTIWAMLPSKLDELRIHAAHNSERLEQALAYAEKNGKAPQNETEKNFENSSDKPQFVPNTFYAVNNNGVAVVDISDVLYFSGGLIDDVLAQFFGGTSTRKLMSDIEQLKQDSSVSSVVLNINSPGGEAFGINELANSIAELNKKKPVTAYIAGYGASAGYFLAASSGRIVADKQAMIGSIGVVSGWADYKDFYKSLGIIYEEVTSDNAPFKRLDPRNEEHRQIFKSELNGMETVFINSVAKGRGVSVETVKKDFGKGAVMAGWQAKKVGMIDETGSLAQVIADAKKGKFTNANNVSANSQPKAKLQKEKNMSLKERIMEIFASEDTDDNAVSIAPKQEPKQQQQPPVADTEKETLRAALKEAHKAQFDAKVASFTVKAESFMQSELEAGRITPAESADFQAGYFQALVDDETSPLEKGSRAERIEAQQAKRISLGLTGERLAPHATGVLLNEIGADAALKTDAEKQVAGYIKLVEPKKASA